MGSALQTNLENLQLNDYTCLVVVTAIVYDYILTFPTEIEYIWNRPWTMVSTLFVIIRYIGLCAFMINCFFATSFLPGPAEGQFQGGVLAIISQWAIIVYICAADLVMILRLWVMYSRSRIILGILLTSYIAEVISSTISSIVYSNPKNVVAIVNQILDLSFCSLDHISPGWNKAIDISLFLHAGVMCTLLIIQFTIRSVDMYRATKQWGLGPIISLMVTEGMVYFFAILMWSLLNTLSDFGYFSALTPQQNVPLFLLGYVPISTLTPRFVLSLRQMYSRSVNVYGERGHGIDTGFGLTTLSGYGVNRSSIVFADNGGREGLERDGEEIEMQRMAA